MVFSKKYILALFIIIFFFFCPTSRADSDTSAFYSNNTEKYFFTSSFSIPGYSTYKSSSIHTSPFNAFAVEGLKNFGEIRVFLDNKIYVLSPDSEIHTEKDIDSSFTDIVFHDSKSPDKLNTSFRFILTNPDPAPQKIVFHFYNSKLEFKDKILISGIPQTSITSKKQTLISSLTPRVSFTSYSSPASVYYSSLFAESKKLKIISRRGWGANEELRFKSKESSENGFSTHESKTTGTSRKVKTCNGLIEEYPYEFRYAKVFTKDPGSKKPLKWPIQYSPQIHKIVIHHTAENGIEERRPKEVIRAIYYYHAISRGWGDIGYNFLIDKNGVIYEGRTGGDFVVGGHVYCHNVGTIGVSLMGNFVNQHPTKKQMQSLLNLLKILTKKYGIHPTGKGIFHGERKPNILGHRDLGKTACPGKNLYDKLPYIRKSVLDDSNYVPVINEGALSEKYAAKVDSRIKVIDINPTNETEILYRFRNTGSETWDDKTWLFVFNNPQEHISVNSKIKDKQFVAANMIEKSVAPGSVATFSVQFKSGYKEGFFTFEFTPIINGKYKVNKASLIQPLSVNKAKNTYKFVKMKPPSKKLVYGQKIDARVKLKNTGNTIWSSEEGRWPEYTMSLGADHPRDRKSGFKDNHRARLAFLKEKEVKPGETGTFVFNIRAPNKKGIYREYFTPVIDNVTWLKDRRMNFFMYVKEPSYKYKIVDPKQKRAVVISGKPKTISIDIKNISDIPWNKDEVAFRIVNTDRTLITMDEAGKKNIDEIKLTKDIDVQETVRLSFSVKDQRMYNHVNTIRLIPVYKNQRKFKTSISIRVFVQRPVLKAFKIKPKKKVNFFQLRENERKTITVQFRNSGNLPWVKNAKFPVVLKSLNKNTRLYVPKKWVSEEIVSNMKEKSVLPGHIGTFTITLHNTRAGFFKEKFSLWRKDKGKIPGGEIALYVKNLGKSQKSKVKSQKLDEDGGEIQDSNGIQDSKFKIQDSEDIQDSKFEIQNSNSIRIKLSFNMDEAVISGGIKTVTDGNGDILYNRVKEDVRVNLNDILSSSENKRMSAVMRFIPEGDTILQIKNWNHRPVWNRDLNDNEYRGILELRIEDDELIIINEIPLEEYLQGVAEVPNSEPEEKRKTLAVLARTYASFYMKKENRKFLGKPYDGSDDPNVFQKYLGYGYEKRSPNFVKAVHDTTSEVVTYNGELIKTPYFNQSDGRTRSAYEVWGWTHTPYLQSVSDPDCNGRDLRGHGVGLSGYGATQMAKRGKTYTQIIKYYYQGVGISNYTF